MRRLRITRTHCNLLTTDAAKLKSYVTYIRYTSVDRPAPSQCAQKHVMLQNNKVLNSIYFALF